MLTSSSGAIYNPTVTVQISHNPEFVLEEVQRNIKTES
jgi:hypothetical protein